MSMFSMIFLECCVLPACRFDERVEVDAYQIDQLNGLFLEGLHVRGVTANGKQSAVDSRV